jgi:formiminotetrahydrofolate cyclodeaminase
MVAQLTLGREKYKGVEADVLALLEKAEHWRGRLLGLLDADVDAYNALMAAYKLPRDSDAQKAERAAAIQRALRQATEVPLAVAEACCAVLDLCGPIAEKGNQSAVSDAGVAALLALAGLQSAALNVEINLRLSKDADFVAATRAQLESLMVGRREQTDAIVQDVRARL